MRIDVGDAEFSKTKEIVFDSEDGSVVCFDQRMQWQFANRADYLELKKLVSNLKKYFEVITLTNKSLAAAFDFIQQDEAVPAGIIRFHSSDGPEIPNATELKGCFYLHTWDEDSDSDRLVVFC